MLKRSIAAMMLVVVMGITTGALAEAASDTSSVRQSLTASPQGEAIEQGEDLVQEQPYLVQITEDDPSIGYVLVQMQNTAGLLPLPRRAPVMAGALSVPLRICASGSRRLGETKKPLPPFCRDKSFLKTPAVPPLLGTFVPTHEAPSRLCC